eukprot:NODE_1612_length_925_cov_232.100457_g475_i1.p1 GENE.NODE_1612_length_925_cov_232.100457_g475_i1~~NODE_1612_length_925_cov_232.100457_g475_i1.p1  ORF type:complete len:221 (-),score=68.16 NODE_1612_length_925_cov_232.100457_g475_i1:186-848(-)
MKVVATRAPYLHPSQRNLKSDQIGPSSHKNEYTLGVLQGNWGEDRAALEQRVTKATLGATTISKASYQHPGALAPIKRAEPTQHPEMPRALMFGHGTDFHQTSFVTTNQCFFKGASTSPDGSMGDTAASALLAGPPPRTELAEKKRQQWQADGQVEDHYKSTKASTLDATAQASMNSSVGKPAAQTSKWGASVKELNSDYRKMALRGPIALNRTPLVRTR